MQEGSHTKPLTERLERYRPWWTAEVADYVLVLCGADVERRPENCLIGQLSRGVLFRFEDDEFVTELKRRMHAAGAPIVPSRDFLPYMRRDKAELGQAEGAGGS